MVFCFILISIASLSGPYATNMPDNVGIEIPVVRKSDPPEIPIRKAEPVNYPVYNVSCRLKTDKPSYSVGEFVQIILVIRNDDEKNITLGSLTTEIVGLPTISSGSRLRVFAELVPTTIMPENETEIGLLLWNTRNVALGFYTIKVIVSGETLEVQVEIKP